ncbi:MAG: hypothetical protein CVU89_17545 [Firmicutes bacterium HGW-Firmicutes-14]|nr:MAG: hypothetical protein CVU89_17545 [Firmicutes bacterium HGW-Firmicutes-14]
MEKKLLQIMSVIGFTAGLVLILNSVNLGYESANTFLRLQGGSMDTSQFNIIIQETIKTYHLLGGIFLLSAVATWVISLVFMEDKKGVCDFFKSEHEKDEDDR